MGRLGSVLSTIGRGLKRGVHFAVKVAANPVVGTVLSSFGPVGAGIHVAGKAIDTNLNMYDSIKKIAKPITQEPAAGTGLGYTLTNRTQRPRDVPIKEGYKHIPPETMTGPIKDGKTTYFPMGTKITDL
jgi:hypothetical protein